MTKRVRRWLSGIALVALPLVSVPFDADARARATCSGQRIPFEGSGNQIYVPVRINSSAPLQFVLDSGSTDFIIDSRRAAALALKADGPAFLSGASGGPMRASMVRGVSLEVAGVEFSNQRAVVHPLSTLERFGSHATDGILGAQVFQRCIVEINYGAQTVTFSDPADYRYAGSGDRIPLSLEKALPFIKGFVHVAETDRLNVKLMIDTGAGGALGLFGPFVAKHKLLDRVTRTLPVVGIGITQSSIDRMGRLRAVGLGRFVFENPVTVLARSIQPLAGEHGLIGAELLSRFTVIFDYSRKQVVFEPNERLSDPFDVNMIGVGIAATGVGFKILTVDLVRENSPASEVGLLVGDVILSIDERQAADLTLDALARMFKQEGKTYRLRVKRSSGELDLRITTRRLI